ncbi:MAG: hypothetical protein Q4A01_10460 [Coriobacteriales bacterium]|nr:hypothetical protein [Coriobacteriales bacterium]
MRTEGRQGFCVVLGVCLCLLLALVAGRAGIAEEASAAPGAPVTVSVSFVGPDGDEWDRVDGLSLASGATAWNATTTALVNSHLYYTTGLPSSREVLVSLMRNLDETPCAFDPATGSGWHLYVNDERYAGVASRLELQDGDQVSWRYEVGTFVVTVSVVGPGGTSESYWIAPTNVRMSYGQSAWDASVQAFEKSGYQQGRMLSFAQDEDGSVQLESLAALGENGITGETWHVYVNGSLEEDVAHVEVRPGDNICWYYSGMGERSLPEFVMRDVEAAQAVADLARVEGSVWLLWSKPVANDGVLAGLGRESGLRLSGSESLAEVLSCDVILPGNLADIASQGVWQNSLARVLDDVTYAGQGGRASKSRDGGLCYLDGSGGVLKLSE